MRDLNSSVVSVLPEESQTISEWTSLFVCVWVGGGGKEHYRTFEHQCTTNILYVMYHAIL